MLRGARPPKVHAMSIGVDPLRQPLEVGNLRPRIQEVVDSVLGEQGGVLAAIGSDLTPLTESLVGLLSGGKRLRAAFCYWGWRATAPDDQRSWDDGVITAATGLEFLQACALIHDDVMDGSDTRRGLPAAHRQFAALHRESDWHGSPETFGVGAAILLGDLCLSWADLVLLEAPLPTDALQRAKPVYDNMRTELMAGQYLDLLEQARGGGSTERALRVVRYKSAKYTIEKPLHLGAAIAGASPAHMEALTAYGLPLGEAFQLRDDILGVFGDPSETGKPAGDDLREGKRTVLIAIATERASASQSAELRRYLGDPTLDQQGVDTLRAIITETGAADSTEELIESMLADSLHALSEADFDAEATAVLTGLAHAATRRSF